MSGVDTRPVPVNILEWPRIRDMIMQQKFIYSEMYFNPNAASCGCYLYGIESTAARLGMTSNSLEDAISEFERRRLIEYDRATGELFVVDWPRWHLYKTPAARGALQSSIERIQSAKLLSSVKKAYESTLEVWKGKDKEKDKASSTKAEEALLAKVPKRDVRQPMKSGTGILCWTDDDRRMVRDIELRFSSDQIHHALSTLAPGTSPLPSRVEDQILAERRIAAERKHIEDTVQRTSLADRIASEDTLKQLIRNLPADEMAGYKERYEKLKQTKGASLEPIFTMWLRNQLMEKERGLNPG